MAKAGAKPKHDVPRYPSGQIRPVRVDGEVTFIPLTKGYEAVIDTDDLPLVEGFNWVAKLGGNTVYAARYIRVAKHKQKALRMHRVLLGASDGLEVDHINGNGLDNRRSNLRTATHAENSHNQRKSRNNTSGYKGVSWDQSRGKWLACIMLGGKNKHLGRFETPDAAYSAYCEAVEKLHGEFGRVA